MPAGSANPFPSLLIVEQGSTPSNPAAGRQKLFIDSADNELKRVDSSGTVVSVEGGGGGSGTVTHTGGALTANAVMLGAGSDDAKVLASLGTSGHPLVSAGAGNPPAFGQVAIGTGVSGLGTGVATALAINVGSAGAIGAFDLIEELTPSGVATITFSSLGTFTHLRILFSARSSTAAVSDTMRIRFNGDTGSNYDRQRITVSNTTVAATEAVGDTSSDITAIAAASATSGLAGVGEIMIFDYRGTTFHKAGTVKNFWKQSNASGNIVIREYGFGWRSTSAITSITLFITGNYDAGSKFSLYGIR